MAYKSKCHCLSPLIPKLAFGTRTVDRHNFVVDITLSCELGDQSSNTSFVMHKLWNVGQAT